MRIVAMWCALIFVAWLPPQAEGKRPVFQWQDAEGVMHFGDRPGAPGAERVGPSGMHMSIVDTSEARAKQGINAMRPIIERELRWQETRREEQRHAAERDMAATARRCAHLREQLDKAAAARHRARERALEEQYYAACR